MSGSGAGFRLVSHRLRATTRGDDTDQIVGGGGMTVGGMSDTPLVTPTRRQIRRPPRYSCCLGRITAIPTGLAVALHIGVADSFTTGPGERKEIGKETSKTYG